MNNFFAEQNNSLELMAAALVLAGEYCPPESQPDPAVSMSYIEDTILGNIEASYKKRWLDNAAALLDTEQKRKELLDTCSVPAVWKEVFAAELLPSKEMLEWFSRDHDLGRYWRAQHQFLKAMPEDCFVRLVRGVASGERRLLDKEVAARAYVVLRHSARKSELDYIKSLGRMKFAILHRSASPGGKLYRLASQYASDEFIRKLYVVVN